MNSSIYKSNPHSKIFTVPPPRSHQSCLSAQETQDEPKAPHAVHNVSAPGPGEEVQAEAVPVHRRAGRVLLLPDPDRDPGKDLVPESPGKSQEAPGGRAGETQDGRWCKDGSSGSRSCWSFTPWFYITAVAGRRVAVRTVVLRLSPPPPQTHTPHFTFRTVRCSPGLQHVPLIIKKMEISLTGVKWVSVHFQGFPKMDTVDVWLTLKKQTKKKQCL